MWWNAQILDISVLGAVPPQIHVVPLQLEPNIGHQQLILLVLQTESKWVG